MKLQKFKFEIFNWKILLYTLVTYFFIPVSYKTCALFDGGGCSSRFIFGFYTFNPVVFLFAKDYVFGIILSLILSGIIAVILYNALNKPKAHKKYKLVFWIAYVVLFVLIFVIYPLYVDNLRLNSLHMEDLVVKLKEARYCERIKIPIGIFGSPYGDMHDVLIHSKDK